MNRFGSGSNRTGRGATALLSAVTAVTLAGTTVGIGALALTDGTSEVPVRVATTVPVDVPTTADPFAQPAVRPADVAAPGAVRNVAALQPQPATGAARIADIPSPALIAYQRADSVINTADPGCHLQWTLLAALGRVLTDHGVGGSGVGGRAHRVDRHGQVTPGLVGEVQRTGDGRRVSDTDAGRLDDDRRHDRTVGPMLIDPTTWAVIGVDGDGDGRRNPQDLDDAALATAVRLCVGRFDLRREDDRAATVRRISAAPRFVQAVLRAEASYRKDQRSTALPVVAPAVTELPKLPDLPGLPAPESSPSDEPDGVLERPGQGAVRPEEPDPSEEPDPTDEPEPSDEPDPSDEPEPSDQPDPSEDPSSQPDPGTDPAEPPSEEPSPSESPTEPPA
ncbi:hypothetical protein FXB39_01695 [Nocardioides sp. BGMRC 2183]|nr:hypothetical protein FXB39_01695 [Nocardioides sp. BGMRC 2183]